MGKGLYGAIFVGTYVSLVSFTEKPKDLTNITLSGVATGIYYGLNKPVGHYRTPHHVVMGAFKFGLLAFTAGVSRIYTLYYTLYYTICYIPTKYIIRYLNIFFYLLCHCIVYQVLHVNSI